MLRSIRGFFANRYARRLGVALIALILLDRRVPDMVARAERARYESGRPFRFENSDLFGLGPAVEYLRENPRGTAPRVVFFGDSVVWGYWIKTDQTVPAQFQRLVPNEVVFNFGINGFETGSAFLISKAIIQSVDTIYLFDLGEGIEPLLPRLIPVSDIDLKRLRLNPANRLETTLRQYAGAWHLYHYAYRLQAAWLGMSTRLYLYQYKGEIVRSALRALRRQPPPAPATQDEGPVAAGIEVAIPRAPLAPNDDRQAALATAYPRQWEFATLVRTYDKRAIVVELEGHSLVESEADTRDLNAHFAPSVQFVRVTVPRELRPDSTHFSPAGARAMAHALRALHTPAERR